jgi:hypothetical protein
VFSCVVLSCVVLCCVMFCCVVFSCVVLSCVVFCCDVLCCVTRVPAKGHSSFQGSQTHIPICVRVLKHRKRKAVNGTDLS